MNRVKYGNKVKVVRKSKAQPKFEKPSVNELKTIYSKLKTCPAWQRLDVYSAAIQWYRKVLQYAHNVSYVKQPALGYSKTTAEHIKKLYSIVSEAQEEASIRAALAVGQKIAKAYGIQAPSEASYLKEGNSTAKVLAKKEKEATEKYDKFLTLLASAFDTSKLQFKVSPALKEARRFDHSVSTMFYSPAHIKVMKKSVYNNGLLITIIDEATHVARAKAFTDSIGNYLVDHKKLFGEYVLLLDNFADWARTSKDAPRSIVRRVKEKKIKIAADTEK